MKAEQSNRDQHSWPHWLYALGIGATAGALFSCFDGPMTAWTGFAVPPALLVAALALNVLVGGVLGLVTLALARLLWIPYQGLNRRTGRQADPRALWTGCLLMAAVLLALGADPLLRTPLAERWETLGLTIQVALVIAVAAGSLVLAVLSHLSGFPWLRSRAPAHQVLPAVAAASAFSALYGYAAARWLPPLSNPVNPGVALLLLALTIALWRGLDRWLARGETADSPSASPLEPPPLLRLCKTVGVVIVLSTVALGAARVRDAGQSSYDLEAQGTSDHADTQGKSVHAEAQNTSAREGTQGDSDHADTQGGSTQLETRTTSLQNPGGQLPDIYLIVLASARSDRMSVYGYGRNTTPSLAALAKEGVVLEQARASSPIALAAFASIFSGLYPFQHQADRTRAGQVAAHHAHSGNLSLSRPLDAPFTTLAELLSEKGYRTAGLMANSGYLDPAFGLNQGFQFWTARSGMFLDRTPAALPLLERLAPVWTTYKLDPFRRAGDINAQALKWLDRPDKRPAFMCLGYIEPHDPYIPRPPFDTLFGPLDPDWHDPWLEVLAGKRVLRYMEAIELNKRYDAEIAEVDAAMGEFFDALKARGRYDSALILVTADHGEDLGEHNLMHHGLGLYEPALQVPFIAKLPGGKARGRYPGPAHVVDVMPIVLEVAGLPVPDGLPGLTLEALTGTGNDIAPLRPTFSERSWSHRDVRNFGPAFDFDSICMVLTPWKYCERNTGEKQLFDLEQDPYEQQNLASELPQKTLEMTDILALSRDQLMSSPALPEKYRKQARTRASRAPGERHE